MAWCVDILPAVQEGDSFLQTEYTVSSDQDGFLLHSQDVSEPVLSLGSLARMHSVCIHLLIEHSPATPVSQLVSQIKGVTGRVLRKELGAQG
ncbi:MAG: hypothetical protein TQ37_05785, partial [Candidatus Synechococcus spongiarum 15L]